MKYLIVVNTLVVIGLCLSGGLILSAYPKGSPSPTNEGAPWKHLPKMLGAGLAEESDQARSDALIRVALEGQSLQPGSAEDLWPLLKRYYATKPHFDKVVGLTVYVDSLEDAVAACDAPEGFDILWAIRKDVLKERREAMERWRDSLQGELAAFRARLEEEQELQIVLETLTTGDAGERLARQVGLFEDLAEQTAVPLPDEVGKIARTIHERIVRWLRQIEKDSESARGRDVKGEPTEPVMSEAKTRSPGVYQKLLDRLEAVDQEMNSEICEFWLEHLPEMGTEDISTGTSATEMVSNLGMRIRKMQQIRYNLWSLRVIYRAADKAHWHQSLGVIDGGQLHPSVHSLYAMTHDKHLQDEADLHNRMVAAQVLLSKEKVPIEAF